ncbi:MAG: SDR family NAD(P)-dependent oxidoreductase [Bacillota bacterium]
MEDNLKQFYRGKVAIVTGASAGIGRAITEKLAEYDIKLVLAARQEIPLQTLASEIDTECIYLPTDVSVLSQTEQLADQTLNRFGQIDFLFNIAGVMKNAGFGGLKTEDIQQQVETNLMGTIYCLRSIVPHMQKQQSGHIVNMSSLLGRFPMPGTGAYCASKFAVTGFSAAIRNELKQDNIDLTVVFPSLVKTGMMDGHMKSVRQSRFYHLNNSLMPEKVATAIVKGVAGKKKELTLPRYMHLVTLLYSSFPHLVDQVISRLMGGWPHYNQPWEP